MLFFAFILGTAALFLQTVFAPQFILLVYAPWLVLIALRLGSPRSLYLAFCAGALLDLLSDDPMGVHALNYVLVTVFLCRYRRFFLSENLLHFCVLTWGASFVSTLLQVFLLFLFDRRVPFTGQWAIGDLALMPLADVLYAVLVYRLPLLVYTQGGPYWRSIKQSLFPTTR